MTAPREKRPARMRPTELGSHLRLAMQFPFAINAIDCFAASLLLYLVIAFRDHRRRKELPYPPGPPSRPIIGNLLDVPKHSPWVAYADISKKHGRHDVLVSPDTLADSQS
jgi:hypothetical protein